MPRRKGGHTRKYRKIRRRTYKQIGGLTPEQKAALRAQGVNPIKIAQIQELELDYNTLVRKVNNILTRIQEREAEERALLIRIQREGRDSRLAGQIEGAIAVIRTPVNLHTLPERIETLRNILEPLREAEADVIAAIPRLRETAAGMNAENARNAAEREEASRREAERLAHAANRARRNQVEANRQEAERVARNAANRARRNQEEANRQEAERLQGEEDALADVPAAVPGAPPPAPGRFAVAARAALGPALVLGNRNRRNINAWLAQPAAPPPAQVHEQGRLQVWEIPALEDIHYQSSLEYLKRKVPQQHKHNCWADSTFVVLLQSTTMNRNIWPLLNAVLNDIITNDAGVINDQLFRLEGGRPVVIDRISRKLLELHRVAGVGGPDPLVAQLDSLNKFTFNIVRYIQKLFQIYELSNGYITPINVRRHLLQCPAEDELYNPLPGTRAVAANVDASLPIASRHPVAAQLAQYAIHAPKSGNLADLGVGLAYLKRVMPTMAYTSLQHVQNYRDANPFAPLFNDTTVPFGYYISVDWIVGGVRAPVGHAMALFKVGTTWYFYDNSNFERVAPFTPTQSEQLSHGIIRNLQISGPNHAEHRRSGERQRITINLYDPPAPALPIDPIVINFGYYELIDTPLGEPGTINGILNRNGSYVFYTAPP
jgi:hypothetical protein